MQEDLLLFWGWTRNDKSYKDLIEAATKNWRITALNFADLTKGGWIEAVNKNVFAFLEKRELKKVSLMGHSLGGALALRFAHEHPEKVKHLYLLDSCGIYSRISLHKLLKDFLLSNSLYGKEKAVENIKASFRFLRNPIQNTHLAYYSYKVDLQKEAKQIKVPTTLIWGELDHLTPLWQGELLHQLIKNSKLVVLKGMDHDWLLHKPELFWANV